MAIGADIREERNSCDAKALGESIRKARKEAGLSQYEVQAKTGIPVSVLSNMERGKVVEPKRKKLEALAEVLGISPVSWLIIAGYISKPIEYNELDLEIMSRIKVLTDNQKETMSQILATLSTLTDTEQKIFADMIKVYKESNQ